MRRSSLTLLRCPRCRRGSLRAESDAELLHFGPVHCETCGAVHPIAEGILDLAGSETRPSRSIAQRLMESTVVARAYERNVRPFFAGLDAQSELLLLRSLLAPAAGETLLDLSCGSGLHACRLAQESRGELRVVGLDRSAPMLREAAHHLTEAGAVVDLVRGEAAELPFFDATVDAVLNVASLHLYTDPAAVFRQVARVLRPGGRLVCATLLPERLQALNRLEARAGVHRYDEAALRAVCAQANLQQFERILLAPWIVFRAVRV